jgi:hypothetical protein
MCPAFSKIEIQHLRTENTVSVPFSFKIRFDNFEDTAREESYEGRDLRWIGAHVSGKYGYVRGERPVYPNWLNHFHPAQKDEGTEEVIPGIDLPG